MGTTNTETFMVLPMMQSVFGAAVGFLLGSAVHTTGLSPVYAAAGVVGVSRWYALLGVLVLFGTYMASGRPNVPFMEPVFGVCLCCGYAAGAVTGDRVNDGISALLFGAVGKP